MNDRTHQKTASLLTIGKRVQQVSIGLFDAQLAFEDVHLRFDASYLLTQSGSPEVRLHAAVPDNSKKLVFLLGVLVQRLDIGKCGDLTVLFGDGSLIRVNVIEENISSYALWGEKFFVGY